MNDHPQQNVVQPTGRLSRLTDLECEVYCSGEQNIDLFFFNLSLILSLSVLHHAAGGSVGMLTELWTENWWFRIRFMAGGKISVFSETSRRAVSVNPASYSICTRLSLHGRQVVHLQTSNAEVKNEWNHTYISGMFLYYGTYFKATKNYFIRW
jgi:hypothetical protein